MKKAQSLVFVLFMLAVFGALSGSLAVMWQSEIQTRFTERDGLVAFYLAQAAVERGKILILTGYWANGTYNITGQNDLDIAGDNYQFLYDMQIVNNAGTVRTLTGTGRVLDFASNEISRRVIQVDIGGISDTVLPIGSDDDMTGSPEDWAWREI